MPIFLGNQGPHWPTPSSPVTTYYGAGTAEANNLFMPGFSNDDAAGSSIKIYMNQYYAVRLEYYNPSGAQITTGVWASGLLPADFSGASAIMSAYMDASDELLYVLLMKTSSSPDEVALATVNKSGQIVQKAWRSFSTANIEGIHSWAALIRPGGDGSGDFVAIVAAAGGDPRRGKKYTIAVSDGAMTESNWLQAGAMFNPSWTIAPQMGPTPNNIWGNIRNSYATSQSAGNKNPLGSLLNATTGQMRGKAMWPNDVWSAGGLENAQMTVDKIVGWRGYYGFVTQVGQGMGGYQFKMDEVHSMMDEMAVQYGIL